MEPNRTLDSVVMVSLTHELVTFETSSVKKELIVAQTDSDDDLSHRLKKKQKKTMGLTVAEDWFADSVFVYSRPMVELLLAADSMTHSDEEKLRFHLGLKWLVAVVAIVPNRSEGWQKVDSMEIVDNVESN
jgi:hypothetical protein